MSNEQKTPLTENNPAPQTGPEQTFNIAGAIITRSQRTRQLLSPWTRRWLPAESSGETSTPEQPLPLAEQRRTTMSTEHTHILLNRVQRTAERSTVWEPDVGSLKPGMTEPLTQTVAAHTQYRLVGVKQPAQPREKSSSLATGLPLLEQDTARAPETAPMPTLLPGTQGQVIPPAPRAKKQGRPKPPVIPPKSRLFTRVQETPPGEAPAKSAIQRTPDPAKQSVSKQKIEAPRPPVLPDQPGTPSLTQQAWQQEMPVRPTISPDKERPSRPSPTKTGDADLEKGSREKTSIQRSEIKTTPPKTEPGEDAASAAKPAVSLGRDILSQAAKKQHLPLSGALPLAQPRRRTGITQLSKKKSEPAPITPKTTRAKLAARGWRFKTKSDDRPVESGRVTQAASNLEQRPGSGKPLADKPRVAMESVIGHDFGDVRVHQTDLSPLNVQAATKGRDVYFGRGQADFEQPRSMALLGHELTHVTQSGLVQTKPVEQTTISPAARMPVEVGPDEAEAERTEQTVLTYARSGIVQRAEEEPGADMGDMSASGGLDEHFRSMESTQETYDESQLELQAEHYETQRMQEEENFADLQETVEEMIDVRIDEMMEALGLDEESLAARLPNLDNLARQILPYLKRLITVERERRA
jgi:hypothetical protein